MNLLSRHIQSLLLILPGVAYCHVGAACSGYDDGRVEQAISAACSGQEYRVELQGSAASGVTPLWLNANKYGLSSTAEHYGYTRFAVVRPMTPDTLRKWAVGYGADVAYLAADNHTAAATANTLFVQQMYAEVRWLKGVLTVGSKYYPMELKNSRLSSGSQCFGINARPVPQVRLALPDYWTVPILRGWLHLKGHLAYGMMTDDSWQHDFTERKRKYADHVFYHSKAGYLKVGKQGKPFSLEAGLEMASTFGGTAYRPDGYGGMEKIENANNLKAFWQAFIPGGGDATETDYRNMEGNHLGSLLLRFNYDRQNWGVSVYADKFFEDQSAMFQIDYDGYGSGADWDKRERAHVFMYDFKDMMLGAEVRLKRCSYLRNVVVEYLYTKYQSGPIYHDHTPSMSDHVSGLDDFYNHSIFTGWQHWGQVMGNPLYRSPIYNTDGEIRVENNRFKAWHFGMDGGLGRHLDYRILATWQEGLGTYYMPFTKKRENASLLVEASYRFAAPPLQGLSVKAAWGMDSGEILGDNQGVQLTIGYTWR